MILDYNHHTKAFFLRVKRGEADIRELQKGYGLDFSETASRGGEAILLTHEPYCAASFGEYATPHAYEQLGGILKEIEASRKETSNAHIRCPMDQELLPFQRADCEYALRRNNTLVGDAPGLGKTPVAICFANEIRAKRVLAIVPANIRSQWARMVRKWSTMAWPYNVYPILNSRRGVHPNAEWTIVSYDLARTPAIGGALAQGKYDLLILDEAHYAKEADSKRTRAIFGGGNNPPFEALASRCGAIMALTGTPLPNRPREAYTLARGLCFDAIDWQSEDSFRDKFNPSALITDTRADGTSYTYVREEAGRHGELQNRLRSHFMVRHEKNEEIRRQLGIMNRPSYDFVLIDADNAVKQALDAEKLLELKGNLAELLDSSDFEVRGHIARVRHQMGIAMAPHAVRYAKMILDGGEPKIFVFAWHIEVLNILEKELEQYGTIRIDGSVSPIRRQQLVDDYIANPRIRVAIGNIQSIGTGTDGLQRVCSHAVGAECSWVPGENQQVVDRLDRGGQRNTVLADFLVAPGSLSEKILSSSLRKLEKTDLVLDKRFRVA